MNSSHSGGNHVQVSSRSAPYHSSQAAAVGRESRSRSPSASTGNCTRKSPAVASSSHPIGLLGTRAATTVPTATEIARNTRIGHSPAPRVSITARTHRRASSAPIPTASLGPGLIGRLRAGSRRWRCERRATALDVVDGGWVLPGHVQAPAAAGTVALA